MTSPVGVDTDNKADIINDWSDVDWKNVIKSVKRLRRRIFHAKKENNFRKLRNLQRLMLKSSSNILYSIRLVASNSGKNTAGIDGLTFTNQKDKLNLFFQIRENKYFGLDPKPTKRIYIKEPTKLRPIGIPTIYDRVIQTMVRNSLEPEWENVFEKGSYGFRPDRNVDDAVSRIWLSLNKQGSRKWVVDTDISRCFDSIAHNYILKKIEGFPARDLIKKWLKVGIIINGIWLDSGEEGTPQGSTISPLLCNISLHGLESELGVTYDCRGSVSRKGRSIIRYADDLIILCFSKEDATKALEDLRESLKLRGLEVSETKTRIVHVIQGFDFLGYTFRLKPKPYYPLSKCVSNDPEFSRIKQENMGLYVNPSLKSIKKIKKKLKELTKRYSSNTTKAYIRKMNEVIRGYVQARWHWHSGHAFSNIGHYIHKLCWRFALRRHKDKGKKWIVENYFTHLKLANLNSKWVFYAKNTTEKDFMTERYMIQPHWFKITDYLNAKMDKLPDNKDDVKYFEKLKLDRIRRRPFNIFFTLDFKVSNSQHFMCPICNNNLFEEDTIHLHHIIPRSQGGKTSFSNVVFLHQQCHIQTHNPEKNEYFKNFLVNYKRSHPEIKTKKGV